MLYKFHKIIFFALFFSFNWSLVKAQTEYIVTVNSTTGIATKIDSIPGLRWLQSASAYNQSTNEYTVMGTFEPGQSPVYLYTLNAVTGNIISKPALTNPSNYVCFQYSRSTGVLYGIVRQNGIYYIATINKTTGAYSILNPIPGIDGVSTFVIDEANQRLFFSAVGPNGNFGLWTIDLVTGYITYQVSTQRIFNLRYDNVSHKLYALYFRPGPGPPGSNNINSICTVNPMSGIISIIADLPGVTGIVSGDQGTFNENEHLYIFPGVEQTSPVFLYSIDVTTGSIISKPVISSSGGTGSDNLVFFRYNNNSPKLYALLWEAKTTQAPLVITDSACRLDRLTKIFSNPLEKKLIVDKNPTRCRVIMNLYNMTGQLLLKNKTIPDGHSEIELANLSSGIYCYEFISNGKRLLSGKFFLR